LANFLRQVDAGSSFSWSPAELRKAKKMKCEEFQRGLEQESLASSAGAHLQSCAACRALKADLDAIHNATLELALDEIAPPDRVWVSLRNQLESEGIIRSTAPVREQAVHGWWTTFQQPAFAGGFLTVILIAGILAGVQGNLTSVQTPIRNNDFSALQQVVVPTSNHSVKEELLTAVNDTVSGFAQEDPVLADSLRRNLDIVDNVIDVCEKSVHDEPENQVARDYLNGAYQQKAELLAAAMNHGVMGGLR
jgi:hypothetical protein